MFARQWSWVWERELESVHFVSSAHMEAAYRAKQVELGPRFQIVFHGTEERSNVESILQGGFDPGRVRRRRRGFSPAWTSSSFDKAGNRSKRLFDVLVPGVLLRPEVWRGADEQVACGSHLARQLEARRGRATQHQGRSVAPQQLITHDPCCLTFPQ